MGRRKKLINNSDIPQHQIEAIARCIMPDILAFYEKGGRTVQTAAPALFAFMGSLSSSVGLSAWRWACAVPRCGSRCFRNGQRKAIIRTHRLSETGSDYIGLVPEVGLEPTRCCQQRILSPSRLPIPSFRRKLYSIIIQRAMQHKLRTQTPHGSAAYAPPQQHE